jgi:hypothetical protein
MTSTQVINTQLIDGLVQTLLALSVQEREVLFQRLEEAKTRYDIQEKLSQYEERYGLSSQEFYAQFLSGALGDAEDYIEWAGFYEMLQPPQDIAA